VWPRGADPSKPLTQSRLSFTRVSKEQRLEQASARILEASAIAAAGRAAEEAELRRIAENSRAGAAARRHASRAVRKASKRAIPIIGALAALRQDDSESDEEPVGGPGRGGRPGPRGRYEAFTKEEQAIAVSFHDKQQGLGWQTSGVTQTHRSLQLKIGGHFEQLSKSTLNGWVKAHAAAVASGEAPVAAPAPPPARMGRPAQLPPEVESLIMQAIRDLAAAGGRVSRQDGRVPAC
jgi:hypothetical protein